jgi:hypothetical protein
MPGSSPPWLPGIAHSGGHQLSGAPRRADVSMTVDREAASGPERLRCSARGCTSTAEFALLWNNPKIHPPERRKTWLACEKHRISLTDHLSARGMFRECEPLETDFAKRACDEPPSP